MAEPDRRAASERQPPESKASKEKRPPAGPHAKPELTDKDKAPESGVLSEPGDKETEAPTG
jgi:hypothetical protein